MSTIPIILRSSTRLFPFIKQNNLSIFGCISSELNGNSIAGANKLYSTSSSETKENPNTTTTSNTESENLNEHEKKLFGEIETLTNQVKELNVNNAELLDKYKRSLADSENLRKRLTKQIDEAKIFGIQKFCKDLLEVADILGHATEAVPEQEISDKNPHLKNLYEGLSMTKTSLLQVFKRHGLEQVNPVNEKFNPNLHEALFQIENKDVEPNTVIEVSKIGYKLQDRCIRPALVGVSRN